MEGKKCWASKYPAVIRATSTARENTESKQNFLLSQSARATSYRKWQLISEKMKECVLLNHVFVKYILACLHIII